MKKTNTQVFIDKDGSRIAFSTRQTLSDYISHLDLRDVKLAIYVPFYKKVINIYESEDIVLSSDYRSRGPHAEFFLLGRKLLICFTTIEEMDYLVSCRFEEVDEPGFKEEDLKRALEKFCEEEKTDPVALKELEKNLKKIINERLKTD